MVSTTRSTGAAGTSSGPRAVRTVVRVDPEEHGDLFLVPEQDVHVVDQQVEELPLVAPDAERVRQGQRHGALGGMRRRRGVAHRLLGGRHVPQVALEGDDGSAGDERRGHSLWRQGRRGSQIGPHGAIGVFGDEDDAPPRAEPVTGRRLAQVRLELDTGRPQVLGVGPTHLVIGDGPHEAGGTAQHGDPGRGVGHRPARDVPGRAHGVLDGVGGHQVDEGHRPLFQAEIGQLLHSCLLNHIEQWRSDRHHVESVAVGLMAGLSFLSGHEARTYPRHRG